MTSVLPTQAGHGGWQRLNFHALEERDPIWKTVSINGSWAIPFWLERVKWRKIWNRVDGNLRVRVKQGGGGKEMRPGSWGPRALNRGRFPVWRSLQSASLRTDSPQCHPSQPSYENILPKGWALQGLPMQWVQAWSLFFPHPPCGPLLAPLRLL